MAMCWKPQQASSHTAHYVQYKVAARVPRTPVWYVPHHLSPAASQYAHITKDEARRQLGLPDDQIIITAPGFITYAKRIPMLLAALSSLRTRVPPFRLVLAGEKCPDQYDVDTDIATAGLKNCASCTGYLDEQSSSNISPPATCSQICATPAVVKCRER